jgi:hypothetical protein
MKNFAALAMVALLMAGTTAYAQTAIPDQNGFGSPQKETTVHGVISNFDLANRTMTLEDGEQFTLAPSVAETSFPEIGEQVDLTYDVEGGQKVVHMIDMGDVGGAESGGGGEGGGGGGRD